jgi:hypothetical protein
MWRWIRKSRPERGKAVTERHITKSLGPLGPHWQTRVVRNAVEYCAATEVLRRRTVEDAWKRALDPGSTSETMRRTAPQMSGNRHAQ